MQSVSNSYAKAFNHLETLDQLAPRPPALTSPYNPLKLSHRIDTAVSGNNAVRHCTKSNTLARICGLRDGTG